MMLEAEPAAVPTTSSGPGVPTMMGVGMLTGLFHSALEKFFWEEGDCELLRVASSVGMCNGEESLTPSHCSSSAFVRSPMLDAGVADTAHRTGMRKKEDKDVTIWCTFARRREGRPGEEDEGHDEWEDGARYNRHVVCCFKGRV